MVDAALEVGHGLPDLRPHRLPSGAGQGGIHGGEVVKVQVEHPIDRWCACIGLYPAGLACAISAAASTIAPIIPLSIPLVTRVPLVTIIKEVWPFVLTLGILLAILTQFPQIILFLPHAFGCK